LTTNLVVVVTGQEQTVDSDGFTEIGLSGSNIIISDGTSAGNANDIGLSIIDIIPFCDDGTVEEI
jgi:hypothetical protein